MTLLSQNSTHRSAGDIPAPVGATGKALIVAAGVLVVAVLIGLYIGFLTNGPTPYDVPAAAHAQSVDLTLQTVAAVGPQLSPNENWVSYLVRENGVWQRSTVWTLPANTLVHVTLYNFDGKSGLRNPFLAQARGLVGGTFALERQASLRRSTPTTPRTRSRSRSSG